LFFIDCCIDLAARHELANLTSKHDDYPEKPRVVESHNAQFDSTSS
jgi:hypothetical protein